MPEHSNETQEWQIKAMTEQKVYAYTNKFMRGISASCQPQEQGLAHAEAANSHCPLNSLPVTTPPSAWP